MNLAQVNEWRKAQGLAPIVHANPNEAQKRKNLERNRRERAANNRAARHVKKGK